MTERGIPPWPCPKCGHSLALQRETLSIEEQATSKAHHEHVAWEPEWIREIFSARAKCADCDDLVMIVGDARLDDYADYKRTGHPARSLYVRAVHPPPPLIHLPEGTPDEVSGELKAAFGSFWNDPSAALNRIRCALERICDHARVRKTEGGRQLSLHNRLGRLPQKFDSVRDHLLAVKHLGNDGSHREGTTDDVLDAFQVLSHVLTLLYGTVKEDVAAISAEIIRKRGSRYRRARPR